jgi:hypothetical protein
MVRVCFCPAALSWQGAPRQKARYAGNNSTECDRRNWYRYWEELIPHCGTCSIPGSNLDKAREVFAAAIKHRPRIRLTMRQRTTCFEQRPVAAS